MYSMGQVHSSVYQGLGYQLNKIMLFSAMVAALGYGLILVFVLTMITNSLDLRLVDLRVYGELYM